MVDGQTRFTIHNVPTGGGKSPAYMTAALAMGKRVAIITESKPLQDQLFSDFGCVGLFDMRGLQNYTCKALAEGGELETMWAKKWGRPTCDVGPCTTGVRCDLKNVGCSYFDDYKIACEAPMVSTNFAYWINIHRYGQGLGKFDILVIDECHVSDAQLSSAMSVEFTQKDFKELHSKPPAADAHISQWRMWGRIQLEKVIGKLDFFTSSAKMGANYDGLAGFSSDIDLPDAAELRFWKRLEGKCAAIAESTADWVVEQSESNGNIRVAPVWTRQYAEQFLFRGIPRIIMTSATVRPKIADLLNIPAEKYTFTAYPSTFPAERRPIHWIPTLRLNKDTTHEDLRTWVVRIDQIIQRRLDRKGIIHTVSFDRQKYLMEHSRFRHLMMANVSGNTRDIVAAFRGSDAPALLVSPSVSTGFDFPFDAARYQIIGKVPFKDPRGSILRAQAEEDPDYLNYLTSQDLIQMIGRIMRDERDYGETLIIDDSIEWFLKRYSAFKYDRDLGRFDITRPIDNKQDYFPDYLLAAFQRVNSVPDPPSLIDIAA